MFGQVVIGPPGAGKTTYCKAMQQFLTALGRKVSTSTPHTISYNLQTF